MISMIRDMKRLIGSQTWDWYLIGAVALMWAMYLVPLILGILVNTYALPRHFVPA